MSSVEYYRARMSNTIARCYFTHASDKDELGRMVLYFSGTVESGPFGFWVDADGKAQPDETVGDGTFPKGIVEPCVRAAKLVLK